MPQTGKKKRSIKTSETKPVGFRFSNRVIRKLEFLAAMKTHGNKTKALVNLITQAAEMEMRRAG